MCGFAGVLLATENERGRLGEDILTRISSVIGHRGPDDSGEVWSGPCGLAHRRLSIIDLSDAGHQPMRNEDGSVWMAYNGETYNFRELRTRFGLDAKGHVFRSRTDTEVLLHLYEEEGPSFLEQLDGMYALALWDHSRGRLLLARDPFGIKPLFYMEHMGCVWFASEIKSLLQAPGLERKASPEALFHYLSFDYVPDTLTPFEGIRELRPGHLMELSPGGGISAERSFFRMSFDEDRSIDAETAVRESGRLLAEAVKRQLVSDVPVGVMLSGGMDSSALTVLTAAHRERGDLNTFSIGFEDPSFDETHFAELVAKAVGTRHHGVTVTAEKAASLLPSYLAHIDEPYADGSAIPTWLLAETAARSVKVLLSGEGGDEVFAGYDTHAALKARALYRSLVPGFFRTGVIGPMVRMLPISHRKLSFEFKAKRFTEGAELGVAESHYFWRAVLSGEAKNAVLGEASRCPGEEPSWNFFRKIFDSCRATSDLGRILCIDTSCHLPHDLMIKNDRMTMAHSIEARVPFTDLDLFRFLARVPTSVKLPGLRKKVLLRKAMKGLLPGEVLDKKKVGLEMPYSKWLRGEMMELARSAIFDSAAIDEGLFDRTGLTRLWEDHQGMRSDNGRALWGILNYVLWYSLYIESDSYLSYIRRPCRISG